MRKWQWAAVSVILIMMAFARFGRGDGPVSRPADDPESYLQQLREYQNRNPGQFIVPKGGPASRPSESEASQIEQLQIQVADLERRVAELENPKGKGRFVPITADHTEVLPPGGR
jgi:hypothetical protein